MKWEGNRESENVEDRRQLSAGPVAAGGGIAVFVIAIVMWMMGGDPRVIFQLFQGQQQQGAPAGPARAPTADETRSKKFAATVLAFTEEVWTDQFRRQGARYSPPKMVLFADRVSTGCGDAPASVGPFYCPADQTVYLDPTFFDELEQQLGGSSAEFSQAYVIAHEVGHHVQNLLGYSEIVEKKRRSLPEAQANEWSVRLELQADYLAGVWAFHGQKRFNFIEAGDIDAAIRSVQAIGDDRLQKRSRGFVSPESFTHGTSEQRLRWFTRGLKSGNLSGIEELFKLNYDDL